MRRTLGINTWVWESPLTNDSLPGLLERISRMGYRAVELPVEHPGDWDPTAARRLLDETGLVPYVVGAMAPGRNLVAAESAEVRATQDYLRHCVEVAHTIGAPALAGPFYAATGRTWRMGMGERAARYVELSENLAPVIEDAKSAGVTIGIEPLNRYETSLINTVEQALTALEPLLGEVLGIAADTYHLNIEEKDPAAAVIAAGSSLVHVQVCGTDRGAVGDDHFDWKAFLDALDQIGYDGPLNVESFTAANETIATAASIWRPLAESQDELASRSYEYLTRLQEGRA
ncbi:MAG TPA: sugar phosphate isomerase/epimerase family protein [Acidimicrobiia bacterium]|nr:sugar phosphate isomerase/epimerase family protein [Acidimicrobiia bacterium]